VERIFSEFNRKNLEDTAVLVSPVCLEQREITLKENLTKVNG